MNDRKEVVIRPLMWFRSDLRIRDNPALFAASSCAQRGVLAAYVITTDQWIKHDMAAVKVDFILRNLRALSKALKDKNIALSILDAPSFDDVQPVLSDFVRRHGCDALFFNREYEINERSRDEAVTATLEASGVNVQSFKDQCVFEPGSLRTGEGRFYTVYTPFKNSWRKTLHANEGVATSVDAPPKQPSLIGIPDQIPTSVPGFLTQVENQTALWPAGETAAHQRLNDFVDKRLDEYAEQRDVPASDGTSALSPYLAIGVLSIRQCLAPVHSAPISSANSESAGKEQWINELIWREFYKHILVGFPRVSMHKAFRRATEKIVWLENDEHFEAWCSGATGYPIIDAAMRQLHNTGWMHNRLRMIVAMFLSKNLFLDWRRGERFFMQHLIDGDLAANNGGWQWAASTGTDAAPYFRVFNPCAQSKKYDPEGEFIRKYLPELDPLETRALHEPHCIADDFYTQVNYPRPIVDHKATRLNAIAKFKALNHQAQYNG